MTRSEIEARALKFLSRREYSRRELAARLRHEEDSPEIEEVLDSLEAQGYLSDRRFVLQILQARIGRFGRHRIVHELKEKGISEEKIAEAFSEIEAAEGEALHSVWLKKFGQMPQDQKEKARQVRFLQSRGFGLDEILRLFKAEDQF